MFSKERRESARDPLDRGESLREELDASWAAKDYKMIKMGDL